MTGFLIGEEGPLTGLTISFEEGEEWIVGRDPDSAQIVLEDPMVSRKHAFVRKTPEGYLLENYSTVNPVTQNGMVVTEPIYLKEGDILQIGSTYFRFSEKEAAPKKEELEAFSEAKEGAPLDFSALNLGLTTDARWLLKVISGPNSGAESALQKGSTYILGKDPSISDILFQDLSVSAQHARISVDENERVFIEDLNSRNGVLVNGHLIEDKYEIKSQNLVSLGTTAFLVVDREEVYETIVAPHAEFPKAEEEEKAPSAKSWKNLVISNRALSLGALGGLILIIAIAGLFSLFKSEPVMIVKKNEVSQVKEKMEKFPEVQFSFNIASGKLFLSGHVLTGVDHDEMFYFLRTLPFVTSIEDNVVVDEFVWENMNALLTTNAQWEGVSIHAPKPGYFVLNGYLDTLDDLEKLNDYVNLNFPYLDRLYNQVIVENSLKMEISKLFEERNLNGIQFEVKNGELIIAGRVDEQREDAFTDLLTLLKNLRGVRRVDNFVILTKQDTSLIDLSSKYKVNGTSRRDNQDFFVVINGKILGKGDLLDGMMITQVEPQRVILEKDGIKFQINYNQQ